MILLLFFLFFLFFSFFSFFSFFYFFIFSFSHFLFFNHSRRISSSGNFLFLIFSFSHFLFSNHSKRISSFGNFASLFFTLISFSSSPLSLSPFTLIHSHSSIYTFFGSILDCFSPFPLTRTSITFSLSIHLLAMANAWLGPCPWLSCTWDTHVTRTIITHFQLLPTFAPLAMKLHLKLLHFITSLVTLLLILPFFPSLPLNIRILHCFSQLLLTRT